MLSLPVFLFWWQQADESAAAAAKAAAAAAKEAAEAVPALREAGQDLVEIEWWDEAFLTKETRDAKVHELSYLLLLRRQGINNCIDEK